MSWWKKKEKKSHDGEFDFNTWLDFMTSRWKAHPQVLALGVNGFAGQRFASSFERIC